MNRVKKMKKVPRRSVVCKSCGATHEGTNVRPWVDKHRAFGRAFTRTEHNVVEATHD